MTIHGVGAVGASGAQSAVEAPKQKFSETLQQAGGAARASPVEPTQQAPAVDRVQGGRTEVEALRAPSTPSATSVGAADVAQAVERVGHAQQRLDQILQLAESGKAFTPAELLAMQAHVYRASQEIDLASKVVDKATGGIKQVLQTNV